MLRRKQQAQNPNSVALLKTVPSSELLSCTDVLHTSYKPFVMTGFVSLSGKEEDRREISILRDTGAMVSIMVSGILSFSDGSYFGSNVLVRGIEMQVVPVPLHRVHLDCTLVSGFVRVGVRSSLHVKGVTFILGNDLAGSKVLPVPEVFSTCAVTRAQSAKAMKQVDLADSVVGHVLAEDENIFETKRNDTRGSNVKSSAGLLESFHSLDLPISRFQIIAAQKDDSSLTKCFSAVISSEAAKKRDTAYFMDDGLLMRRWCSKVEEDLDWNVI